MAQMAITAKIQVVASDEDKALLDETMSVYREACNYVLILSILVDTFISKISFPMQPGPEIGSISDA